MVELGIVLANGAVANGTVTTDELLALAEQADQLPELDYVWVGDSLVSVPRLESTVLLAACAARTRRVRLGVGCLASMGLRDPLPLAFQWASLDVLSGGRMTLVACTGPNAGPAIERELALFGLSHERRAKRMEEWVALLRLLSTEGRGDVHGDEFAALDVAVDPGFVQRPLPIWMVANPSAKAGPKTLAQVLGRVGRLGDGWMTFGTNSELIKPRLATILEHRAAAGRPPAPDFPVCVYVDVNIHPNEASAFEDALATSRREGRHAVTAESLRRGSAVGSVEHCVEFLLALVDAGATNLAIRPLSQDPRAQLELISEHLIPALKPGPPEATHETRNGDEPESQRTDRRVGGRDRTHLDDRAA